MISSLGGILSSLKTELYSPIANCAFVPARTFQHRSKCEMNRRSFAYRGIVGSGVSVMGSSAVAQGIERLPFKPEGYNFSTWRDHKVHHVVHGFGASVFHWRYNIPQLAKKYKVYAIDLLGFGWSDKAIIEYDAMVWRDHAVDFLKEIVKQPAVLVGNSLG